jgi:redox-sensing transcriptional repressor
MPRHQQTQISGLILGRLAFYLRTLTRLAEEGHTLISSQMLAEILGLTAAQVRKDLSVFGGFGKQGTGYEVAPLRQHLTRILNIEAQWPVVVLGAGDLGRAIAGNATLRERGFEIVALFDNDPAKVGTTLHELPVYEVEKLGRFLRRHQIEIAIVAVPAVAAQAVAELLVSVGIRAILNYAPTTLNVPSTVRVEDVDPVIHLQRMAFHLRPPTRSVARPTVRRKANVRTTTFPARRVANLQHKNGQQVEHTISEI